MQLGEEWTPAATVDDRPILAVALGPAEPEHAKPASLHHAYRSYPIGSVGNSLEISL
jgi:hypothetical protein